MAIGNMFQGMARGKVGDVVFAVREGKQVSRVRNRKPKNPQTNKQIMQRAIMATVLQAYSAGKEIFDHSFQGKSVGEQCAREFLSLNAKALRAAIAAEQAAATPLDEQKALVVLPKATLPVANAYIVSQGTYENTQLDIYQVGGFLTIGFPEPVENETAAAYASRNGFISGDLFTIVIIGEHKSAPSFVVNGYTTENKYATDLGSGSFIFVRLRVKANLPATALSKVSDIFEVTKQAGLNQPAAFISALENSQLMSGSFEINLGENQIFGGAPNAVCAGIIRSRTDEDLRSNTVLTPLKIAEEPGTTWNTGGIVGGLAIQAWKQRTAQLGDSDLILEGGDV